MRKPPLSAIVLGLLLGAGAALYSQGNPHNPVVLQGGGGGAGVSGLTDCTAGNPLADNEVMRADGTTGCQGSTAILTDAGALTLTGQLLTIDGTKTAPAVAMAADPDSGFYERTTGRWTLSLDNNAEYEFQQNGFIVNDTNGIGFASGNVDAAGGDAYVNRQAAGVIGFSTSPSGLTGWPQWAGQSRVTADTTLDSITPATMTLTPVYTLRAGATYSFDCKIFANTPTAADGFRIDMDGGTATATAIRYHVKAFDETGAISVSAASSATALATDLTWTSTTGDAEYAISGTITVNAAGTFIPRYAKEADAGVAATLYRGSFCWMQDMP